MEFYLRDCITGNYQGFTSMKELAKFWRRKFGESFGQLNLTGKDILTNYVYKGIKLDRNGLPYPQYELQRVLRQYQVLDKDGRSIDIRTWPNHVWQPDKPKHLTFTWTGRKCNRRRVTGPSLQYRLLKAPKAETDEYTALGRTDIRSKALMSPRDWWDYYDRASCRSYCKPRSWKNQSRSRHQWARKTPDRRQLVQEQESGENLARRLSDEICGVA